MVLLLQKWAHGPSSSLTYSSHGPVGLQGAVLQDSSRDFRSWWPSQAVALSSPTLLQACVPSLFLTRGEIFSFSLTEQTNLKGQRFQRWRQLIPTQATTRDWFGFSFTFMMLVVGDQLLLEVFSNLNASVILWNLIVPSKTVLTLEFFIYLSQHHQNLLHQRCCGI